LDLHFEIRLIPCYFVRFEYIVATGDIPVWRVRFFKTLSGGEPVRDWIKEHSKPEMKLIGGAIKDVQFSKRWAAPLVKHLRAGLHEIRIDLFYTTARVLFFRTGDRLILVHGFTKKSRTTPKSDLDLSLNRKRQYEREN
jgi:phage-related protein